MATNFTWTIIELNTKSTNELDNIVTGVTFTLEGVDDKNNKAEGLMMGSEVFDTDPNVELIPFNQLTNDKIVEWVKQKIGSEGIAILEKSVQSQIDIILNPPSKVKSADLPW